MTDTIDNPRWFSTRSLMAIFMVALAGIMILLNLLSAPSAHGATLPDAGQTAQTSADAAWAMISAYGPLWGGLGLFFALSQTLLRANDSQHWISQGRTLAVMTGIAATLGAVLQWHFQGAPAAGIIVTVMSAISLIWHPTVAKKPSDAPSVTPSATILAALVIGCMAMTQVSCGAHHGPIAARAGAGIKAALDCEKPNLVAVALDGFALATQAIISTISGGGHPDAAALKAALGAVKSDGLRCAASGAIAALLNPPPPQPGAPAAAGLQVNAAELRAAFAAVREEWGVASVRVAGQTLQ